MDPLFLAIDQGTTSTRAIVFSADGKIISLAQKELTQIYPRAGWVEHDGEEIWNAAVDVCRKALEKASLSAGDIVAIGITNQRETSLLWDRATGRPIHNAIVWQDRRTSDDCLSLKEAGHEEMVQARTGLLLDPYFSASKLAWMLDNIPDARQAAARGDLAFGTVDSFLLWHLTGGRRHATDATNASRTMLFNIHTQDWDADLLELFRIPRTILPEVLDSAAEFGESEAGIFGSAIPVRGIAGDQHAALIGQACFRPGEIKSTYGTGCFAMLNTGDSPVASGNRLLTTMAYRLNGKPFYALEGSIFVAGAAVQWLRDKVGLIKGAEETESHARSMADTAGVYLVPAFAGLGAPYWDSQARGAIVGLSLDSDASQIIRSALESVCYQTRDLIEAMRQDGANMPSALRVDGGMVANDWLMQFLADIVDVRVDRPAISETTALGAAYLAGLGSGLYRSTDEIAGQWSLQQDFHPGMQEENRERLYKGWRNAVDRVRN